MGDRLCPSSVSVYSAKGINLHAYRTADPMDDEVFIAEKNGRAVVIESPCFYDNIRELEDYMKDMKAEGVLVSYHGADGTFLKDARKYSTDNAASYSAAGGGKILIDNFTSAFGSAFDSSVHKATDIIGEGEIEIAGIRFIIKKTAEAFDIGIPEINAVYTHMLGHDCHSIIGGKAHAQMMIDELNGYLEKGYELVLSSHYTPESLKDVRTKIQYLENVISIAGEASDKEDFITRMNKVYPDYSGSNYLSMTASAFFG